MKYIIIVILLVQCNFVIGQRANKQQSMDGFYLGFNTTNVIKNLLSFNSNAVADPYSLVGLWNEKGNAIRLGLGLDFETKKNENTILADNTHSDINFRIGFQKNKHLWNKMYLTYGLDLTGGWEKDFTVREGFYNEDNIWSAGGGPVLGIMYHLNERLSISTESNFYFNFANKTTKYKQVWSEEEVENSTKYSVRHVLPNSLYVYFRL